MPEPRQCPSCGSQCVLYDPKTGRWACQDCGEQGEFDVPPESKREQPILDITETC